MKQKIDDVLAGFYALSEMRYHCAALLSLCLPEEARKKIQQLLEDTHELTRDLEHAWGRTFDPDERSQSIDPRWNKL